jgi:hypothetical protein
LEFCAPTGTIHPVPAGPHDELVDHLVRSSPLSASEAARVVAEVLHYFAEPLDAFVRRRHRELQVRGWHNDRIFAALGAELATRRVAPPALSARQLRRIVYG